jgi:hypothetical protein
MQVHHTARIVYHYNWRCGQKEEEFTVIKNSTAISGRAPVHGEATNRIRRERAMEAP